MSTQQNNTKELRMIVCIGGRCSTWGRKWSRHLYEGGETCLRCGMDRKEQFEEDKFAGLVTGSYKPNTGKTKIVFPITSKQIMYCAVGDYGIEFADPSLRKVKRWIKDQREENDLTDDYYEIDMHTKAELAAMPED